MGIKDHYSILLLLLFGWEDRFTIGLIACSLCTLEIISNSSMINGMLRHAAIVLNGRTGANEVCMR